MASQHAPTLRSLYRRILRELPARAASTDTILSRPTPIQQRLRTSFATPATAQSDNAIFPSLQEAEQFVQYLKAQRVYTTLVERYNPGGNMTEEERVRLSARRVGMNLPIEFKD